MVQEDGSHQLGGSVVADVDSALDSMAAVQQQMQAFASMASSLPSGLTNGLDSHAPSDNSNHNLAASAAAAQVLAAANGGLASPTDSGSQGAPAGKTKAKPPRPDVLEPCPRCGSGDTKFCYYNNYNVKQPRYFCKSCQRYWTAGGTLRNVPVGSGRRKSKSAAAKEQEKQQALAEQLAKQSMANAMALPSLAAAAAAPFLNPMLDPAMLAYNVAAQQQLLGSAAALNALTKMPTLPNQWPSTGHMNQMGAVNGGVDASTAPASSAGNGTTQASAGTNDEPSQDGQPLNKRSRTDGAKPEPPESLGALTASLGQGTTTDDAGTSSTPSAGAGGLGMSSHMNGNGLLSNGMAGSHNSLLPSSATNGLMSPLSNSWPNMNGDGMMGLGSQGVHDHSSMMHAGSPAAAAAAAAHNAAAAAAALQQQQLAYQQVMQSQLLQQQLAAQAQVAAGLGAPNPYAALSLQHLAAFNPYAGYANLAAGFNPTGR